VAKRKRGKNAGQMDKIIQKAGSLKDPFLSFEKLIKGQRITCLLSIILTLTGKYGN
jgi:hypothetical protein